MLYILAIFGGVLGLLVTGVAIFTAYTIYRRAKGEKSDEGNRQHLTALGGHQLKQWTVFDLALFALMIIGMLFLFVDLLAVMQDRDYYPTFHFGYLLSAFVFLLLGVMFMLVRLAFVLSSPEKSNESSVENHKQ